LEDKKMAAVMDKKTILRDKRAQGIAAMGLVSREGDRFRVQTPSLRGRRTNYEVWRDEQGRVRCTCLEFEEQSAADTSFRCEHILAVKHSLAKQPTPNSEPVTKQQSQPAVAENLNSAPKAETKRATPVKVSLNINARASEKPAADNAPQIAVADDATSFVRERNEETEAVSAVSLSPVSLAQEGEKEEMRNRQTKIEENIAAEQETAQFDETANEDARASVVPFAFANTLRTLRQPVDPKLVKTREGWTDRQGNTHMVEYVEWHTVADILDRVCPTWSHSVRNVAQIGDMVAVTAAITIDGVTREGVGTGTADNETGIKKAEHDALKRAAIKFGLARELYQRETEVIEKEGRAPAANEFPRDPLAKTMSDLVTPKQLGMIRALAREAGVDVEQECQNTLRCRTEELSKRAASSFIDHLKNLQAESGETAVRRAS
jgi:hypothetical protein